MRLFRTIATAAALAALLAAAAPAAEARTKRFRPQDFTPASSTMEYTRSPIAIGALLSAPALFTAPLGLPKGATITGIRLYSNGLAASRSAVVVKFWSGVPSPIMASVSESALHLDLGTPMVTAGTVNTAPDSLVQAGRLYFVHVGCAPGTAVWAVDVDYTL